MHGLLSFLATNLADIKSSAREPVMLVCLAMAFVGAFRSGWSRGLLIMLALAMARVVITDYQHFSPGVPPSVNLVYTFTAALISMMIVFVAIKFLRELFGAASGRLL